MIRDANGEWYANKNWETASSLKRACHNLSVFFSDETDAILFKLTFG